MKLQDIEEAIKEVMGKDPVEMVIRYYESLIQHDANIIAECQRDIIKHKKRIAELKASPVAPHPREEEK